MNTPQYCPFIRHDLFGFTSTPFLQLPPKPWLDENRKACLKHLTSFLQARGFAAIAGKCGTGKTAIINYLIDTLHQPSYKIVYVPCCHLSETDLLRLLCIRFDMVPPYGKTKMINAIQQRIQEILPIHTVIIFDEMQNASLKSMDLIRMLANHHFDPSHTLSSILIGTSEFFDKLRLAINEFLRQRITCFQVLEPIEESASNDYIAHCLAQASAQHPIFAPPALKLIYDLSEGILRTINKLAASTLAYASEKQSSEVLIEHVQAIKDYVNLPTWNLK